MRCTKFNNYTDVCTELQIKWTFITYKTAAEKIKMMVYLYSIDLRLYCLLHLAVILK